MLREKEMDDPLGGGLPSRIYVAAFPRPRTSYQIAKMIIPESPAENSSGRLLRLVEKFPKYFRVESEWVSPHRMRVLITSDAQPFFSRIAEECQLSQREKETLEKFELHLRGAMDAYLEATLGRNPRYLTRSLNAFHEVSSVLCLTLYTAKNILQFPQIVRYALETDGFNCEELMKAAEILAETSSRETIIRLCIKIREATTPLFRLILAMIDSFEDCLGVQKQQI